VNDPPTRAALSGKHHSGGATRSARLKTAGAAAVPNQPGLATSFAWRLTTNLRTGYNSDPLHTGTSRVDWNITDRDRLFWTYSPNTQGPRNQGIDLEALQHYTRRAIEHPRTTGRYSKVLSPRLVNEFLAMRSAIPRHRAVVSGFASRAARHPAQGGRHPTHRGACRSFGSFGNSDYQHCTPARRLSNIVTYVHGRHNLRSGAQYLLNQFWYIAANGVSRFL